MAVKVGGWGQGRLKLSSPLHHPYWFWYLSSLSIIHHYVMKNWYVYDSWNIQIAAIMQTPGEFIHHPPCLPHSIHVPLTEPLLTIYAWTGQVWSPRSIIALLYYSMFAILYLPPPQLNGRFWFGDTLCGEKFSKELKNVEDPRQFYNEVSSIKSKIKVSVFLCLWSLRWQRTMRK